MRDPRRGDTQPFPPIRPRIPQELETVEHKSHVGRWFAAAVAAVALGGGIGVAGTKAYQSIQGDLQPAATTPYHEQPAPATTPSQNTEQNQQATQAARRNEIQSQQGIYKNILANNGVKLTPYVEGQNEPYGLPELGNEVLHDKSSVKAIEYRFGTDYGLEKADSPQAARDALVNGNHDFKDITPQIADKVKQYPYRGTILLAADKEHGVQIYVSLGATAWDSPQQGRSMVANANGVQDIKNIIGDVQYVIAPKEVQIDKVYQAKVAKTEQAQAAASAAKSAKGKHIVVDLSTQTLMAYSGSGKTAKLVYDFPVSTGSMHTPTIGGGTKPTPTPTGNYDIYSWLLSTEMKSSSEQNANGIRPYDDRGVPYVMYFTGGIALHGAPWNRYIGIRDHGVRSINISHGCVNMTVEDAKAIYDWTLPATHPGEGPVSVTVEGDSPQ